MIWPPIEVLFLNSMALLILVIGRTEKGVSPVVIYCAVGLMILAYHVLSRAAP